MPRNGSPSAISSAAAPAANGTGRRMIACERRYQKPPRSPEASRCSEACQRFGLSAFTRGPSAARIAGSSVSETSAAISAHATPPTPIEYRKRSGKTSRAASAAATVTDENSTVRPAVAIVARRAGPVSSPRSSSSRKRETMNSE